MPVALSAISYIYEGVWVDWTSNKGPVLGSILTVNPTTASILSPALAIIIAIAGSQLWTLFQFALHQIRATSRQRSLIFHQQQVVLRNTATDLNTIWRLLRIAIAWRHQKDVRVFWSSLPLISGSLIHFGLIVFLGLFSSWLLEAGDKVLSRSPWCGTFGASYIAELYSTTPTPDNARLAIEYANYFNMRYASVQQHVDICQTGVDGCDTLPTDKLRWTSNVVQGACPFGNNTCNPTNAGSISFDTGFLSSASDLGFNANAKDRVAFRMTAQCAPLNDRDHATTWQDVPASSSLPARQMADVFYGPTLVTSRNATFSQTRQIMDCDQRAITPAYSLNSVFAAPGGNTAAGTATFDPISELQSTNADTSLITMSFNTAYEGPVSDPWFSAQIPFDDVNAFCINENKTLYTRDLPLTTMGCTQQWQVCNSDAFGTLKNDQCTPQMGLSQVQAALTTNPSVAFSSRQLATANRIINSATGSSFFYVIWALSQATSPPLQARKLITNTVGRQLPNNQWEEETKYWVEILLASLQQTSLDYSTGQFAASTEYINVTKDASSSPDEAAKAATWLCQNQTINSTSYRNFHFFALILTVVICFIIIILGLSIEDVIGYIRQRNLRYSGVNGKQDMWIANSDIEMLRTIDESKNGSTWGLSRNGIPVAPPGYKVSVNDLRANSHEVEKGTGIVVNAVKRQQTGLSTNTGHGPYKHAHNHPEHKRCATCSTFDLSSGSGNSSPRKSKSLKRAGTRTPTGEQDTFVFNSGFKKGFERDFHPKLAVTEVTTPNTISSEVLPGLSSRYHSHSPQQETLRHNVSTVHPPLPTSPLVRKRTEGEALVFGNTIPAKISTSHNYSQNLTTPTIEITPVSPPISQSEYSSASDTERDTPAPLVSRNAAFSSKSQKHKRNRTQDMSQVYESPSSPTTIDDIHTQQPPAGWGVLPKQMSGLWNLSWSPNAHGENRGSYVR